MWVYMIGKSPRSGGSAGQALRVERLMMFDWDWDARLVNRKTVASATPIASYPVVEVLNNLLAAIVRVKRIR